MRHGCEKCTCGHETAKFTVGNVWAEGRQVGNIDTSRVLELLQERWQERWILVFGRMHTLRTDPDGSWRHEDVHERLSDMQIVLDLHPGEASRQASVTENTIGIVSDTITRIALERPDLKSTEVLAAAVLSQNEMERVRGFSSDQRALGRSPNWDQLFIDIGNETLFEVSGTSARDGSSRRRVAESTQGRRTEESISGEKQALGTFQTW